MCYVLRTCDRGLSPSPRWAGAIHGCSREAVPLCLMVRPKFWLGPGLCASRALVEP